MRELAMTWEGVATEDDRLTGALTAPVGVRPEPGVEAALLSRLIIDAADFLAWKFSIMAVTSLLATRSAAAAPPMGLSPGNSDIFFFATGHRKGTPWKTRRSLLVSLCYRRTWPLSKHNT